MADTEGFDTDKLITNVIELWADTDIRDLTPVQCRNLLQLMSHTELTYIQVGLRYLRSAMEKYADCNPAFKEKLR